MSDISTPASQSEAHKLIENLLLSDAPKAELDRIADEYNIANWGQSNAVSADLYDAVRDLLGKGAKTGNDLVAGKDTMDPIVHKVQTETEQLIANPSEADADRVQTYVLGFLRTFVSQLLHPGTKKAIYAQKLPELIKLYQQVAK
tara:strand:+ start:865 stop:1299 length:435 start_codon:yes stop_codon:yes gene_type:complete